MSSFPYTHALAKVVTLDMSNRRSLYFNGTVLVCDESMNQAEALVVENGKVLATGALDEMKALAGKDPNRIDIEGAVLMPGFVDSHPHFLHFGTFEVACVNILSANCHGDIIKAVRDRAKDTPPGQWILTTPVGEPHYFIRRSYKDLAERRLPNRWELDQATGDHPVMIQAWAPRVPNIVAFNSAALRVLGISRITPDQVCNVRIEKDGEGQPTGIMRGPVTNYYTDDPFWLSLLRQLPMPPAEVWTYGAYAGQNLAHQLGVTTAYEAHCMEAEHVAAYQGMRDNGTLNIRVKAALELCNLTFDPHVELTNEEVIEQLVLAQSLESLDDDMLRIRGISMGRGGPCWPGYLRVHDEMLDPFGQLTRGKEFLSKQVEELVVEYCLDHGLMLNMVQGGYRDQDDFFDTVGKIGRDEEVRALNWMSQHNILITENHCARLAELNMTATTSMSFSWGKGDLYEERIGKHAWRDLVPLKRMLNAGLTVGCGTDWGPKNIFEHIALSETHEFCGSGHCNNTPDHALTRAEAIGTWTHGSAKAIGWNDVGSLQPGNHADLILVDQNPLTCATDKLPETQVLDVKIANQAVGG